MRSLRSGTAGRLTLACAALAIGALTVAPAGADELSPDCRSALEARLAELGIAPAEVRQTRTGRRSTGSEIRRYLGLSVWLTLERCEGSLVIDLDTACRVKQAYTRGACRIEGLKHW